MFDDMFDLVKQYNNEKQKWKEAGKPIRSKERMEELHSICQKCPFFNKGEGMVPGSDECDICGCNLHPSSTTMNKLAWGTTHCPDDPSRWGPDVES